MGYLRKISGLLLVAGAVVGCNAQVGGPSESMDVDIGRGEVSPGDDPFHGVEDGQLQADFAEQFAVCTDGSVANDGLEACFGKANAIGQEYTLRFLGKQYEDARGIYGDDEAFFQAIFVSADQGKADIEVYRKVIGLACKAVGQDATEQAICRTIGAGAEAYLYATNVFGLDVRAVQASKSLGLYQTNGFSACYDEADNAANQADNQMAYNLAEAALGQCLAEANDVELNREDKILAKGVRNGAAKLCNAVVNAEGSAGGSISRLLLSSCAVDVEAFIGMTRLYIQQARAN